MLWSPLGWTSTPCSLTTSASPWCCNLSSWCRRFSSWIRKDISCSFCHHGLYANSEEMLHHCSPASSLMWLQYPFGTVMIYYNISVPYLFDRSGHGSDFKWVSTQKYHRENLMNCTFACLDGPDWGHFVFCESIDGVAHVSCKAQEQGEPKSATRLPESSEDGLLTCHQQNIMRILASWSHKMMFRLTTKIAHVIFNCVACDVWNKELSQNNVVALQKFIVCVLMYSFVSEFARGFVIIAAKKTRQCLVWTRSKIVRKNRI